MNDLTLKEVSQIIAELWKLQEAEKFEAFNIEEIPFETEKKLQFWKSNQKTDIRIRLNQTKQYIDYLETGKPLTSKRWEGAWRGNMTRGGMSPYLYMLASMVGVKFNNPQVERRLLRDIIVNPYLNRYVENVDLETTEAIWKVPDDRLKISSKKGEENGISKCFSLFKRGFSSK